MACPPDCIDAFSDERRFREAVLSWLECIYEGNIEGVNYDYEFLCDPVDGRTIVVRYCNNEDGTPCTPPVEAFELNGDPYPDPISGLVPCGGDSTGQSAFEYVVCDAGTTKIVRVCLDGCTIVSVSYFLLDRSATTTPADFGAVTYGPCTTKDDPEVLCDDDGAGTFTPFLRRYVIDHLGAVAIVDTLLDGTTVYAPSGTVTACDLAASGGGLAVLVLCDDDGAGTVITFLRHIDSDGAVTDTELDGTTPYVASGTVGRCCNCTLNTASLCDSSNGNVFLRSYIFIDNEFVSFFDTDLDGVSYGLVGTAVACEQPNDIMLILCDSDNDTRFLRRYAVAFDGTVSTADTELDGSTPYVLVGTAVVCQEGTAAQTLCDVDTYGDQIAQFTRVWKSDTTFDDFEMDGTTPYTPVGTVEECCCEAQNQNISPSSSSSTTSGSTTAGIWSVSITNIGGSSGTVAGVSLPAGMTVTFTGYYDEEIRDMKRLAAIAYDATGTTFRIDEIP